MNKTDPILVTVLRHGAVAGRAHVFRGTLDEPLSAVDENTRGDMHELLRRVRKDSNVTVLHVTHNAAESLALADIALELRDGRIFAEGRAP